MDYDPRNFWNDKARRAPEPLAAVCRTDPASSRNIDRIQRRLLARAFAHVAREVPLSGMRVLDYGCGVGRFAPLLAGMGCRYSGVDIAEEMVAWAAELHPGCDFRGLVDGRIPHDDATFDLVLSVGVIHHNPYPQQGQIIREILRVLRPDGHVVMFEAVGRPDATNRIEFARPVDGWRAFMADHGLSCVSLTGGRYFLTRDAWGTLVRGLSRHRGSSPAPGWVDSLGTRVDPVLGSMLPRRYQRRAAMVFRRRPGSL